ncbi:TonB-dependent receptor [Qipengyuania marisflavi]|uniref:TonB-dependent receptor n=1 Tax=Qipengyuania marisflavi TaxID=2486356 RepID=A0A5S3Q204_9SPHN|nr:TonB-dependent receptor [Qipengyuania marisflavi]TMM50397.1 TonB-dependent receptor [Qipengyuania marisflavi]
MRSIAYSLSAGFRVALLAGAAALALPSIAQAQDVDPGDVNTDGDSYEEQEDSSTGNVIIVTATKREQTLQEIPVAVSVTSAETIERNQIRDLKDLQTLVPSLRVNQLQSSANTNFLIRGFGNGANNAGIEPSVGVFVDGVYRSRTASQITDLPDVQRVEVLRGPQSTLFGKNASAGVISIITKEPEFNFGGSVELSYGNFDAIVGKALVTGPISDSLAFSVSGGINKRDGYLDDLGTGSDANTRDRWFTRGQLLFDNGGAVKVRIIGDYDKIDEVCCGVINLQRSAASNAILAIGGQIPNPNDRFADVIYNNFDSANDIENYGISGQIDFELSDAFSLTSITAYRKSNVITNQDSDFTSADLIGRNFADVGLDTFTQELRLAGEIGDRVTFLVGGFYFNEDIEQSNEILFGNDFREYANLLIGGPVTSPPNDFAVQSIEATLGPLLGQDFTGQFFQGGQGLFEAYTLKNEALSFFGQVDFEFVDGLVLTLGANYTDDKKRVTTNVVSTDVFSGLDLQVARDNAFNFNVAQTVGGFLGIPGGGLATPDQIAFFAANFPDAFGAITQGVAAAVDPLLDLQPLQFLPPFLNIPNSVEDGRTADNDWSWTARLAYDVTPELNVYLSYATGFKASSFNLSRDSRPLQSDLPAIVAAGLNPNNLTTGSRFAGPEDTTVYEMGIKGNWDVFSANLTFFQQQIDGFQSNIFTGTGFALANAGKQETFGIEFDSVTRITDSFNVMAAFTYLKPEYVSFPNSSIGDLSGREVAGISQLTMSIGAQYNKEINDAGDRIILNTNFYHEAPVQVADGLPGFNAGGQGAAFAAARPFRRQVDELSASITYAMGMGLELTAWGRNLLDDRYITTIFDSVAQSGSISGYPNQPRTYGVAVKYKF